MVAATCDESGRGSTFMPAASLEASTMALAFMNAPFWGNSQPGPR